MMDNINTLFYNDWLDDELASSVPISLKTHVTTHLIDKAGFDDGIIYIDSEATDTYQCYHTSASSTTMDWTQAYIEDNNTFVIISALTQNNKPAWTPAMLDKIAVEYRSRLKS